MTLNEFCKIYDLKGDLSFYRCNLTSSKRVSVPFGVDSKFNIHTQSLCECRSGNALLNPFEFESIDIISKNEIILHRSEFDIHIIGCSDIQNILDRNARIGELGIWNRLSHSNSFSIELSGGDFLYNLLQKKYQDLNAISDVTLQNYFDWHRIEDYIPRIRTAMESMNAISYSCFHIQTPDKFYYDYFALFN